MKRVPHQEYHFTVGQLPYGVNPGKPVWPWKPEYDGEEEPEPAPRPRLTILSQILGWFR